MNGPLRVVVSGGRVQLSSMGKKIQGMVGIRAWSFFMAGLFLLAGPGFAQQKSLQKIQTGDLEYNPRTKGLILVDHAHQNIHKLGFRLYSDGKAEAQTLYGFEKLVENSNYEIDAFTADISLPPAEKAERLAEALKKARLFLIANPKLKLSDPEVQTIIDFHKKDRGSVLILADHPPYVAPLRELAYKLGGFILVDGYAKEPRSDGQLTDRQPTHPTLLHPRNDYFIVFSRQNGGLPDLDVHPVFGSNPISKVVTYTGSPFLAKDSEEIIPLLTLSQDAQFTQKRSGEESIFYDYDSFYSKLCDNELFDNERPFEKVISRHPLYQETEKNPALSCEILKEAYFNHFLQGAVYDPHSGAGRVALFAEAAAHTAQVVKEVDHKTGKERIVRKIGFSSEEKGQQNEALTIKVIDWLMETPVDVASNS